MPKPSEGRQRRREWERRNLFLVLGMLLLGGEAIIGLLYGRSAALSALLCLVPAAMLILLLWLLLVAVERWLDRD